MWEPYIAAIQAKAPQAAIVFDNFHVIRHYSRVVDRVRLDEWTQAVEQSQIEPLRALARMLQRYSYGLFNHCHYPIYTARLEGLNNKIKDNVS